MKTTMNALSGFSQRKFGRIATITAGTLLAFSAVGSWASAADRQDDRNKQRAATAQQNDSRAAQPAPQPQRETRAAQPAPQPQREVRAPQPAPQPQRNVQREAAPRVERAERTFSPPAAAQRLAAPPENRRATAIESRPPTVRSVASPAPAYLGDRDDDKNRRNANDNKNTQPQPQPAPKQEAPRVERRQETPAPPRQIQETPKIERRQETPAPARQIQETPRIERRQETPAPSRQIQTQDIQRMDRTNRNDTPAPTQIQRNDRPSRQDTLGGTRNSGTVALPQERAQNRTNAGGDTPNRIDSGNNGNSENRRESGLNNAIKRLKGDDAVGETQTPSTRRSTNELQRRGSDVISPKTDSTVPNLRRGTQDANDAPKTTDRTTTGGPDRVIDHKMDRTSTERGSNSGTSRQAVDDVRRRLGGSPIADAPKKVDADAVKPGGLATKGETEILGPKGTERRVDRRPEDKNVPGGKITDADKRMIGDKLGVKTDVKPGDPTPGKNVRELDRKDVDIHHGGPQLGVIDSKRPRFDDRFKAGEIDPVMKGDMARKVKLDEQYKIHNQGDIARRLDLTKHAVAVASPSTTNIVNNNTYIVTIFTPRPGYMHGPLSMRYGHDGFRFSYFGPSFYAGPTWYPSWTPWVRWSWGYHMNPVWDPRPVWCRPVAYDPWNNWSYWNVPETWEPLPAVACGTWVEVARPKVVEALDLQLLAVRFVDPGHPEEKLGPRYRVWFRNNSAVAIDSPFTVTLFASNGQRIKESTPRQGARVKAIDPGDIQSVDIRLPYEVMTMNRDENGEKAPFAYIQVLVDSNREVMETAKGNNGACIARDDVLPVDPASFDVDPDTAKEGGEMIVAGEGFGPAPGQAIIHVNGKEYSAEIIGWYDLGARFAIPEMRLQGPTKAEVIIIRGDGAAANTMPVTIVPGAGGAPAAPIAPAE